MRLITVFFIGLLWLSSCASENNETTANTNSEQEVAKEDDKPEPSQEELTKSSSDLISKVIDASSLQLQLNGESKWEINNETFIQLMKIKQQIYVISGNMENYEVASYNEMGAEFLGFVKTIPPVNEEVANLEYQKIISATKEQCLFMLGSNLQKAQIAVINLSTVYDEVPKYFESIEK